MTARQDLRERWASGQPAFGAWSAIDSGLSAEILASAGFAWVCVDLQHGAAALEHAGPTFQSISIGGALPLARVPANDHWAIGRSLDLGAGGVIVPMVDSPDEAAHAVRSCLYPPRGSRSFGPIRTTGEGSDPLCIVMCETRESVERLDEICGLPGVDGVYVGPRDLALSFGLEPGPALDAVVTRILGTCRDAGLPAGIHARSGASARAYADDGFLFAAVGSDRDLLAQTALAELTAALGRPPDAEAAPGPVLRAAARYV